MSPSSHQKEKEKKKKTRKEKEKIPATKCRRKNRKSLF